jgi:hypothetical protein
MVSLSEQLRALALQAKGSLRLSHAEVARRAGYGSSTVKRAFLGQQPGSVVFWEDVFRAMGLTLGVSTVATALTEDQLDELARRRSGVPAEGR